MSLVFGGGGGGAGCGRNVAWAIGCSAIMQISSLLIEKILYLVIPGLVIICRIFD